ncbi:MAG: hypothetical protein ACN4GW_07730 [Desulforhopalus sp.]
MIGRGQTRYKLTMQTLSSKYTFFYKFIFILIWFFGFALGTREVLFIDPQFDSQWTQYLLAWLLITLFIFFATGSIKSVSLDREKKQLVVSNYIKTETINFSEIIAVDGSSLLSPKLVWVILKKKSQFGRKISLMPAHRPARSIGKHPLVMELHEELNISHLVVQPSDKQGTGK